MQEREARLLIDAGALRGCTAAPAPLSPGRWVVLLHRPDGRAEPLERQRGGERVFASLDSAAGAARGLGFGQLVVNLG